MEQEISNFLVSISKIRAEIESLQTTLESKRESSKVKLNAKVLNQSELEKSISDLKKENEKISSENIILQREILSNGVKIDDLFPIYEKACSAVTTSISSGIPFKRKQRLSALKSICLDEILSKNLTLETTSFFKLWSFIEDEYRFSNEINLGTSEIVFENQKLLVETLKIGTYSWFAKTSFDTYLVYSKEKEVFVKASQEEEVAIRNLMVALKRNIRTGQLKVPLDKKQ